MSSKPRVRSKTGCATCRRRRVKCDERRPICERCHRTAQVCSFQQLSTDQQAILAQSLELATTSNDRNERLLKIRTGRFSMSVHLPSDVPEQAYRILEFYGSNLPPFVSTADQRPSSTLIYLLPVASQHPEVMLSLLTVLSVFMPPSWTERNTISLRLATSALARLRKSLLRSTDASATNEMILTAGLLYLFELHNRQSEGADFAHLSGIGFMLKNAIESSDRSSSLPVGSMESYAYHAIVSSTCNHNLLLPQVSIGFAEQYLRKLAGLRKISLEDLHVLGVRAQTIIRVFKIAMLRREVLSRSVSLDTFEAVKSDLSMEQMGTHATNTAQPSVTAPAPLEEIYALACHIFSKIVLSRASKYGTQPHFPVIEPETFGVELARHASAIEAICARPYPYHTATWPLFVIGLAAKPASMDWICDAIDNCLQRHVELCNFGTSQQVRNILMNAWDTGRGPSLLMAPWLSTALMF